MSNMADLNSREYLENIMYRSWLIFSQEITENLRDQAFAPSVAMNTTPKTEENEEIENEEMDVRIPGTVS